MPKPNTNRLLWLCLFCCRLLVCVANSGPSIKTVGFILISRSLPTRRGSESHFENPRRRRRWDGFAGFAFAPPEDFCWSRRWGRPLATPAVRRCIQRRGSGLANYLPVFFFFFFNGYECVSLLDTKNGGVSFWCSSQTRKEGTFKKGHHSLCHELLVYDGLI